MYFGKQKKLLLLIISCFTNFEFSYSISEQAASKGFVYLNQIDPTIIVSLRYITNENFVGKPVDGYKKPVLMVTKQAAEALKKVQQAVKKDGYSLVIYDAYRPQQAVNNFVRWADDIQDQSKKAQYYPRVDKAKLFELGYVSKRSGHSKGSRVDLTIIKVGQNVHEIVEQDRKLLDGYTIKFLDDGTVDMGSSFDLFDQASHYENNLISKKYKKMRTYLRNIMEKYGFKTIIEEWWHFTLKNEPYPANEDSSYFDFDIE